MNEMKEILLHGEPEEPQSELPGSQQLLFAPIDKLAFGVAIGTACGLCMVLLTVAELVFKPNPSVSPGLMSQYFTGYDITWPGAAIGGAWAFFSGFCAGWFTAFVRNLVLALSLFVMRSRAELSDSRDFLDHI